MRSATLTGLAMALVAAGPAIGETEITDSRPAMGTVLEITLVVDREPRGRDLLDACFREVARLDAILSDWREDSELMRLAARAGAGWVTISRDLEEALVASDALRRATGGAFDVTVGAITHGLRANPAATALDRAGWRLRVGGHRLRLRPGMARLDRPGVVLDLGGIGKGYAADRLEGLLRRGGARSGFINFGRSTMLAFGDRAWPVLIATAGAPRIHELRDASLSTSQSGPDVGTLLDPRTGGSIRVHRLVTVEAPTATRAEGWSTAIVVLGAPPVPIPRDLKVWCEDAAGARVTAGVTREGRS